MSIDKYLADFEKKAVKQIEKSLNDAMEEMKYQIDQNTPIDTSKLINDTKVRKTQLVGNKLVASVDNRTKYAVYVEYGVGGRKYNYHKRKQVYYSGVGARMFARSIDKLRERMIRKIKNITF